MTLIVNVVNDVVGAIREQVGYAPSVLNCMFPFGDVYLRALEFKGQQWRVLQRGSREGDMHNYVDTCLPIEVHQLPECVQVVHLCTE